MSFLTVVQAVAKNAGLRVPQTISMSDADQVKLAEFINETGLELARRVDWGALRKIATITSLGTDSEYSIAADFDRLSIGANVAWSGTVLRGSLTADEWFVLEPVQGDPRYFYLRNEKLGFYPYPAISETVRVQYQSKNWAKGGTATALEVDADTALVPDLLLELGGIWRWRRHVGKDYSDHMAEFEAALIDRAKFDGGVRSP